MWVTTLEAVLQMLVRIRTWVTIMRLSSTFVDNTDYLEMAANSFSNYLQQLNKFQHQSIHTSNGIVWATKVLLFNSHTVTASTLEHKGSVSHLQAFWLTQSAHT